MKKLFKGIMSICLSAGMCLAFSACSGKNEDTFVPPDEAGANSIITKLDLSVTFEGDIATAKVKNTFTLFPAKASVYVYLYYSESYTDDYAEMKEVASNYTEDLNIGKTLTASYDTKGYAGYFVARMRYKIDSREWEEKVTDVYVRDGKKPDSKPSEDDGSLPVFEPIEDDGSLPVFEDIQPAYSYLKLEDKNEIFSQDVIALSLGDEDMGLVGLNITLTEFENKNIKEFNQSIGKEFIIFNPKKFSYVSSASYISYSIYQNETECILKKSIELAVREFGFPPLPSLPPPTGFGRWNIKFDLEFVNIDNLNLEGKFKIEFGKDEKTDNSKFINLYIGEICIGTCYYETDTVEEVTYAFFYNLFAEGLSII